PDPLTDEFAHRIRKLFDGQTGELLPYLMAMLGFPPDPAALRELEALSPEARQFRTTEAVVELIRRLARERPVVVAMEDLHWADAASMHLLERLFPVAEAERTLLVITLRPEPDHPSWRLHDRAVRLAPERVHVLTLEALPPGADRALLEAMVGRRTLPTDVERRILGAAEGNPLFLEELVRSLIDAEALVAEGRGWRFQRDAPLDIPPTVERLIISRIDRLSPGARDAIQAGSVLGRQFGRDLLEAVAGGNGALSAALGELLSVDLLRQEAASVYRFKHALIQEAAYHNMLRRRRRELHARAAEALETLYSDKLEPPHGVLARHYRGAGRLEESLRCFELAATEARRIFAVEAALEHYTDALEVAETLGSERTAELRLRRGQVRAQAGQFAAARDDFEVALGAARTRGDRALEVEAMNELGFLLAGTVNYQEALPLLEQSLAAAEELGFGEAQVAAASRLSIAYTNLLRLDLAVDRARRAWALAGEIAEERSVAMAMDALQVASVMVGDMATVDEVSAALVEVHRRRGDLWYLQLALFQWAWVDMAAARWDAATKTLSEGLAVNRRIGDRGNEPIFLTALTWVARARGQYGRALELGRRSIELAAEVGHAEFLSWAAQLLGWTLLEVFAISEAVEQLERSAEVAEESGNRIEIVRAACHLPLARWLAGDHDRALQEAVAAEGVLGEVTAPPDRRYLQGADGPIALATLRIAEGDAPRALELAEPVLTAGLAAQWHEVVAGAALASGRAKAMVHDTAGAVRVLETAVDRAERCHVPGLAWRAHAELAVVGPRGDRAPHEARARELVEVLSRSMEDASMRRTFLDGAAAELSGGVG
ncbi:MAG TPA: AAA family ATPase, partial [Actinomycetota bacterium]